MEGHEGGDPSQCVTELPRKFSRGLGLTRSRGGGTGGGWAEVDIGDAGAIGGRCLVVVGIGGGRVLEVLLEFLQGDRLGVWERRREGSKVSAAGPAPAGPKRL